MKNTTSRRSFLQRSAVATAGLTVMSSSAIAASITSQNPYEGYNPYSEEKTDLRTSLFKKHVCVKGTVYDAAGKTPVPGILIEVWHCSPNSKKFRHRANFKTNKEGNYKFITDFPGKGENLTTRIYFKITNNHASYFTELAVGEKSANITSKHWEENQLLGENLLPTSENFLNTTTIDFNLKLTKKQTSWME